MIGCEGYGRFGGRKNDFNLTAAGKAAAARLEALSNHQPGGPAAGGNGRPPPAVISSHAARTTPPHEGG